MGSMSSPIPSNVVAWVGGLNSMTRSYTLCKNGQIIVIQAPPLAEPGADLWSPSLEVVLKLEQQYFFGLEHIQTLLSSIEFGKTNWAYMLPHPKGGYHIVQKQKSLYKVRTPTWAPLIEEKEMTYVKWFLVDVRIGYWKGRGVDVILGYEDNYLRRVDSAMMGYRLLEGLDLTYDVLAHVVQSDGAVIGMVTEPEVGRLVQFRDRALVYDAISRLQQNHLIYNGIHYSKIHILDGKVRLSNLASISYVDDPVELERTAEIRHWTALEEMFRLLRPDDEVPRLAPERTIKQLTLQLIPDYPSPRFMRFIWASYIPEWFADMSRSSKSERTKGRTLARKRNVVTLAGGIVASTAILEADSESVTDAPISIQGTRHRPKREIDPLFHPYRQGLLLTRDSADTLP